MRKIVEDYLKKKKYTSGMVPIELREAVNNESREEREGFLIREGFYDIPDMKTPRALDLTDEEYLLVKAAYNHSRHIKIQSQSSQTIKIQPQSSQTMTVYSAYENVPQIVVRAIVDIILVVILGIIIGNYEYLADLYDPEFRVDIMIKFWCYSAVIFIATSSLSDSILRNIWRISKN